jgi:hypothetical protein
MTDYEYGEFSVWQFFPEGIYEAVRQHVSAAEAVKAFKTYTQNPASMIGITQRVIITDGGDYTVAEWIYKQGYTYPPEIKETTK